MALVKILVVDDEPDVASLISQRFETQIAGFEVDFVFAENGKVALEKLDKDGGVDVVLTDINMPIMDGLELLGHINKRWPLIKVVVVSAYSDMKNIRMAMNQGAFDFVIKPIDFRDLELTVASSINAAKEARSNAIGKLTDHEKLIEIEKELEMARQIQSAVIPKDFTSFPGQFDYEIYGTMIPAKEVGGDFFDSFSLGGQLLGMTIADVSGKGVPAALFMSMSRAALRCFASKGLSVTECISQTNEFLCSRNDSCMFVTIFYGVLNFATGELHFCNAGHNSPLILSSDGKLEEIGKYAGIALGINENFQFVEGKTILKNNDCLLYYTDGVSEAMNESGEQFTVERLQQSLIKNVNKPVGDLIQGVLNDIKEFVHGAEQSDDITILCIKSRRNI